MAAAARNAAYAGVFLGLGVVAGAVHLVADGGPASERTVEQCGAALIRVNPVHDEGPAGACAVRSGGLAALCAIDLALAE